MLQAIQQRLTYANVISTLCLFLLLGGGTAVALRGHNSVRSDDIRKGGVKRSDIGKGAVGAKQLAGAAVIPTKLGLTKSSTVAGTNTVNPAVSFMAVGGPSVAVDVPQPNALVAVYASAELKVNSGGTGLVGLAGPRPFFPTGGTIMSATSSGFFAKASAPGVGGGANADLGGWLIGRVAGGNQTFELRYGYFGTGTANFRNRALTVAVLR